MGSIQELAEDWLRLDQDPITRDEIQSLVDSKNTQELEKRLRKRIAFGTAGLRARMEAGFSRLNSLTIIQASQGLAAYLLENAPHARAKGVVIGYDARHQSEKFARLAAAAFVAKGIKVWWYKLTVHTPLVPFGVGQLGAAAGVMVTASHNPSKDNGYKVYWSNGCQIIPPHDVGIAQSILKNLEPVSWDADTVDESLLVESILGRVRDAYYSAVTRVATNELLDTNAPRFVYTPMHGVGLPYMQAVMERLGLDGNMIVVPEQAEPDPDFPTVKFPNPEEKGALDLAMATADRHGISLVLASDPDADRLAVAEKVDDKWHVFTGNELGVLFAAHVLESLDPDYDRSKLAMLSSAVSSSMLSVMAASEGFHHTETLTGFKWLGNGALDLEERGYDAVYAYEEAIGYMFSSVVHDKDALSAAAVFLSATATWTAINLTPFQKLQQLYKRYGYFASANTYLIANPDDPGLTNALFDRIRALGGESAKTTATAEAAVVPDHTITDSYTYPKAIKSGTIKVTSWRDLTVGYDSSRPNYLPILPVSKDSQMITCELDVPETDGVKVTVRGSGTEPKIKFYVESRASTAATAQASADAVAADIINEWFEPEKNGLTRA
ncbi:hypothetical protein L228DRAFT_248611 [Xylona heveae TC161]|uniref:Phosphoglucomutase-2 n=1 Tax=Xylona heveae (strain CBS 132557 / TC161) TaxID=1328760 RepID=A0A165G894_XYLHT|nr:hypothetical protein L228DRAFT_248611 [Xylona heveae TC161]KZF21856.1 hypothetical protein L228DRAFT_248611 [Xylona heveae TC161]